MTQKTRVLLVRHGATELSREDRFAGATEVGLSEEGRHQARSLARRIRSLGIGAVYSSPMGRTRETARILAEPLSQEIVVRDGLQEISHGRWEAMTRAEVESRFPDEYARWVADPYTFAPAGGESGLSVTARALPVLLGIVEAHPGGTVLVVSHKATIRLLLSALLGFDPRSYRDRLDQNPAALNILDVSAPARARLVLFNDTSHYESLAPRPSTTARLSPW